MAAIPIRKKKRLLLLYFVMTELFESSSSFFLTVILKEEDIWHSSVCVVPECKHLENSKRQTIVTQYARNDVKTLAQPAAMNFIGRAPQASAKQVFACSNEFYWTSAKCSPSSGSPRSWFPQHVLATGLARGALEDWRKKYPTLSLCVCFLNTRRSFVCFFKHSENSKRPTIVT